MIKNIYEKIRFFLLFTSLLLCFFVLQGCSVDKPSQASSESTMKSTGSNSNIGEVGKMEKQANTQPSYIGMWVTKDGSVRQELLPNGRYDEARGTKKSAYTGSYTIKGNHIDYVDDTGFSADGEFRDGILYHAGMVLYREKSQP
ncbi:agrobacterium tumefaciens protein [Methylomusa anaerophila]|uniref:Agrobacterium tumefaciens protein n=2 Tax=Methylomusa anaerophila TaxID=1930071 RepID=A0A348AHT9_9FIRM|nr:agrobacterium tumefaciens protein [Methylomusa anaerophila]